MANRRRSIIGRLSAVDFSSTDTRAVAAANAGSKKLPAMRPGSSLQCEPFCNLPLPPATGPAAASRPAGMYMHTGILALLAP